MTPLFFKNAQDFRSWLFQHHRTETELIVGFYKVKTKKPCMSWSESVDQALCFGWIDGIRKSIDDESYSIRFTPRRTDSIWSVINVEKVKKLTKAGLMMEEGLEAFKHCKKDKFKIYGYENPVQNLAPEYLKQFKILPDAWDFFTKQAPSYQRIMIHWVMSAKKEETRSSRLNKLIHASIEQKRIQ